MKKILLLLVAVLGMSMAPKAQCNNWARPPCGVVWRQPCFQPIQPWYSSPVIAPVVFVTTNNTVQQPAQQTQFIQIVYENGLYYQTYTGGPKSLANGTFVSQSDGKSRTYTNGKITSG